VRLADSDGTSVLGDSHRLLRSASATFADTVEAPSPVQTGSWSVLFVSHGNFQSGRNAEHIAALIQCLATQSLSGIGL
jgi:hypothetical protein